MKKTNWLFVAFALMMLVLIGCSNALNDSGEQDTSIPDGLGAIEVSFTQGSARTALPDVMASSFNRIEYLFAKNGGTPAAIVPQGTTFFLEPGTYQLTVKAYMGATEDTLAAQGSSTFTITAGQSTAVTVTMQPIASEGAGTFEFSMSYPAGITVETYTLSRIAGAEVHNLLNYSSATGSDPITRSGTLANVAAGYYLLQLSIKNGGGVYAGKVEVVHIYRNLVTRANLADYTFNAGDFAGLTVSNATEWEDAVNTINAGGNNMEWTITITNDFSIPGGTTNTFSPTGLTVTIIGNHTISMSLSSVHDSLLKIGTGQSVIVHDVDFKYGFGPRSTSIIQVYGGSFTMRGNSSVYTVFEGGSNLDYLYYHPSDGYGGGVGVGQGTFTMEDSASVYGNSALQGGGVDVQEGIFTMKDDASVYDNVGWYGGGVNVHHNSEFTMSGNAKVYNNAGYFYGGGVVVDSGYWAFTMQENSAIYGNRILQTPSSHDTLLGCGGGVLILSGNFTKTGGTIYGNNEANVELRNIATCEGHAIYQYGVSSQLWRDTTADLNMNIIDSIMSSASHSFWEFSNP